MTLLEVLTWARIIVRTCEDMGLDWMVIHEAQYAAQEIEDTIAGPPLDLLVRAAWLRCDVPKLQRLATERVAYGHPEGVRAYEAIAAVRLLAAEAALSR